MAIEVPLSLALFEYGRKLMYGHQRYHRCIDTKDGVLLSLRAKARGV